MSWDAFHEGNGLKAAIERYREENGYYPEAVLADRIYRTRENLQFCKTNNIRLSGPRLGRPAKLVGQGRRIAFQDNVERNAIEGKIGEGKRCYGLDLITAKLPETSGSMIAMQVLVMNLSKILRDLFGPIFDRLFTAFFNIDDHRRLTKFAPA